MDWVNTSILSLINHNFPSNHSFTLSKSLTSYDSPFKKPSIDLIVVQTLAIKKYDVNVTFPKLISLLNFLTRKALKEIYVTI